MSGAPIPPSADPCGAQPPRCWPTSDPLYIAYHDEEWGRPVRDDARLLERLCLEGSSPAAWCAPPCRTSAPGTGPEARDERQRAP